MINFCTLFDHNYLSRGLVLLESLRENCSEDFKLYILACDKIAYDWLVSQNYEDVVVQSVEDLKISYPVLEKLQKERTRAEFSWTISSFSIQFFIRKFNLEFCIYVDADLCFYDDPVILLDELSESESVIITPHNYSPKYDQSETCGRYCVQFVYFKNNEGGNKVLEWWRASCEECCCGVPTDGKFGDQKYLDDWLTRFSGIVHEEKYAGCGVAPWNCQKFDLISNEKNKFDIADRITKEKYRLVFFHFHGIKELIDENNELAWNIYDYDLAESYMDQLYRPYLKKLIALRQTLPPQNLSKVPPKPKKVSQAFIIYKTFRRTLKKIISSFFIMNTYKEIKKEYTPVITQRYFDVNR